MRAVIQMMALTTAIIMIIFSPTFFAGSGASIIGNHTTADLAAVAEPETFPIVPSSAAQSNCNLSGRTGDGGN